MSDKKNSHNSDLEANLAKIANTKPRKRMRKDNIYERFITRVENVDGADDDESKDTTADKSKPLKDANKLSSYEPLSAAELALFATQIQEGETLQVYSDKGINLDFSDEYLTTKHVTITNTDESLGSDSDRSPTDTVASTDTDELVVQDPAELGAIEIKNKESVKPKEQQASSKKPLVVGMVFGSLLIAAIVMMLIFTGILSTSTKTAMPDNTDTPATKNTTPAVAETIKEDIQPSADPNTIEVTAAESTENGLSSQNQAVVNDSESAERQQPEPTSTELTPDTPITYEDFRQESQSTLYRETND